MPKSIQSLCLTLMLSLSTASIAQAEEATTSDIELTDREKRFAAMLSNVTLVGTYTQENNTDRAEKERYTIYRVSKIPGRDSLWRFDVRMEFGTVNLRLPLALPVQWVGRTPLIVLDDYGIPGLGSFSARVLFDGSRYAGTWQHGKVGGHLFGIIEKNEPSNAQSHAEESEESAEKIPPQ